MLRSPQRFVRLDLVSVVLPFRMSFHHAAKARRANDALLFLLYDDFGHCGYGEALPREYLSGETVASVAAAVRQELWPQLKALSFGPDDLPSERLGELFTQAQDRRWLAAFGGLDLAVHDGWARRFEVPGGRLMPQVLPPTAPSPRAVSAVLGFGRGAKWLAHLGRLAGFCDWKVKVGTGDAAAEHKRLTQIRERLGEGASLRVDANGAWTYDEALTRLQSYGDLNIDCVEQPLASSGDHHLSSLQTKTGLALMADESLCTLADGERLAQLSPNLLWNLRVGKVGGLTGMRRLMALAAAHQIPCQLGALVGETALLAAAGRACLDAYPWRWVESSFSQLLLRRDPFRGAAQRPSPQLAALGDQQVGLGVGLDLSALAQVSVGVEQLS